MTDAAWARTIDQFYERDFDDADPQGSIARMRELVAERPEGDAEALFELAGVYDSLGLEDEAIPLYRRAIEAGLEDPSAVRAPIQLASSLRNVGASADAVSILESMPTADGDEGARQAFLALALHDEGRYGDALRTALLALIPTLDGYRRSLSAYAAELPSSAPRPGAERSDVQGSQPAPGAVADDGTLDAELDRILAERNRDDMQPTIDALLPWSLRIRDTRGCCTRWAARTTPPGRKTVRERSTRGLSTRAWTAICCAGATSSTGPR